MTRHYFFRFSLLILMLSTGACSTDVTDEVSIDTTPKLVVVSFISPQDTVLQVKLQKTQPAVGETLAPGQKRVPDAMVQLSDGSQTAVLHYEPTLDVYQVSASALPIQPGKAYFLNVAAPGGFTASATSTVPRTDGILIKDISIAGEDSLAAFRFTWHDVAGQANYYRPLGGSRESAHPASSGEPRWRQRFEFNGLAGDNFYSDEQVDGELLSSREVLPSMPHDPPPSGPYLLHALLAVTDRHYHKYHRSVYQQQANAEDPFAEPTQIYSNIQGGLGVFAAFNEVKGVKRQE